MDTEELADFIFMLQMDSKIAKDFGAFLDSNGNSDIKQWLSHVVPALRDSLP
jgi:hypothetical protein